MPGLPTEFQNFIHLSRYARWSDEDQRRENWPETISRYVSFFKEYLNSKHDAAIGEDTASLMFQNIHDLKVMPSMRCLMSAGPSLARDHVAGYNCAYRPINSARAFDEILFILMCGTGVGFSVERQEIDKLPTIPDRLERSNTAITVRDSKRGWSEAYSELIAMLYAGRVPQWDISQVRKKGERLLTMGGRASGPGPLVELFNFTINVFENAAGRKLTSIECHDIACKIGECVVVGGVRRSAMLSLSNLSDLRMRDAKAGQWWESSPWLALANNSVAYTEKPEVGQFMQEWISLYGSKSGERGIFNREAARVQATRSGRRRGFWDGENKDPINFGTNPCSEIILRPEQFCNLTEIVARREDTYETLMEKAEVATILGTWQACLTDFRYISKNWKTNCDEERLLGVSMTGIMDCSLTNGRELRRDTVELLEDLKRHVHEVNLEWSERLGINPATATTCVKPSGTASKLVLSGSGIHSWHARQYVQRVRQDTHDPLTTFMIEAGFPYEADVTNPDNAVVFDFPVRAPEGAVITDDRDALQELEHWKLFQDHWCEHKPSVTISVRENEWPRVGAWVWDHFDEMSGVSFLPHSNHTYRQAPYESMSDDQMADLEGQMPKGVDWTKLADYEKDDEFIVATKEFACVGDSCEIL